MDVPQEKKRRGRPPTNVPRVEVLERDTQTEWDTLLEEIIARREREPFAMRSLPIQFKDPTLTGHWINRDKYPDAIVVAKQKGWRGVKVDMVKDLDQLGHYGQSPDGFVVRGERGNEILMCMPEEYVQRIAMAKTRVNDRNLRNPHAQRAEVIEAYGKEHSAGADLVHQQDVKHIGRVETTHEQILVTPPDRE